MATIYVRSTDGSDSDDGSTWALSKATINGAAGIDAAGDTIYVSDNHAESTASAVTWALAGTAASPVKIIGADDAAEPPTALAAAKPTVSTTGANGLTINGCANVINISFSLGTSSTPISILSGTSGNIQYFKDCKFSLAGGTGGSTLQVTASSSNTKTTFDNVEVRFNGSGQTMNSGRGEFVWRGGAVTFASNSPTNLIGGPGTNGTMNVTVIGVDISGGGTGLNIFQTSTAAGSRAVIRGCRMPTSWSGSLVSATPTVGTRFSMYNCDNADTNYRLWIEDGAGSIKHETTLIKTGGASDGTTGISWKMVSNTTTNEFAYTLDSDEIAVWNETTGSSVTITIDILRDSATNLKDNEIWMVARYLGTSGYPLESTISDCKADFFATAADQTSSSATWTTTGMSNPNTQKLSVTFTPQEKGWIYAKVRLAKTSTTVYIDPIAQVS